MAAWTSSERFSPNPFYKNVVRNTIADSNYSNIVAKLVKYVDLKYSDMYVVDLFANLGNKQTNYHGM